MKINNSFSFLFLIIYFYLFILETVLQKKLK